MKLRFMLLAVGVALPASARAPNPTMHEPIPVDARDDLAMGVLLQGDIPAAIETRSGVFNAPDPTRSPSQDEIKAASAAMSQAMQGTEGNSFIPDRDTRRPDVLSYVDPFTPATAPFKRLMAFDAVDARFALFTRDTGLRPLAVQHGGAFAGEDVFYADLPVEIGPDHHTRIPSVGPGTRVLHAHLGVGPRDLPVMLKQDDADNWFLDSNEHASARLVLELAIARAVFGGDLGDPEWSELPSVEVPSNVLPAAQTVAAHIGLSRGLRPVENVRKMVAYFRAFADSDQPLTASKDVYTDLAMSQKGVCRHRAYAFTITALGLGIPTRMVINEAHAWVEVYDGKLWRRIDLGGAGRMLSEEAHPAEPYAGPKDTFPWPTNATRGDDMVDKLHDLNGPSQGGAGAPGAPSSSNERPRDANDKRPTSTLTVDMTETDVARGAALHVKGGVTANGEACGNAVVTILLRDPSSRREARVGSVTADARGAYAAVLVLPTTVPLGEYEVVARTEGDARCGRGASP